jgi:hypothetical protein
MSSDEAVASRGFATADQGKALTFDASVANQARVYDYVLGGRDNFAADRAAAEELISIWPEMAFAMRANRAFLGRAVRYLAADAGIRQFLDVGTGIPTAGNTHQIAQEVAPESRVVYADYDPIVLAHARALLTSTDAGATEYIHADLRDTSAILRQASELLDFTKPVAITLVAILHAIPEDDNPHAIVAELLAAVPPGSYLALTHMSSDLLDEGTQGGVEDVVDRMVQQRLTTRSRAQVARFFTGTDLVEPGIVAVEDWRPKPGTSETGKSSLWCGVGRKR